MGPKCKCLFTYFAALSVAFQKGSVAKSQCCFGGRRMFWKPLDQTIILWKLTTSQLPHAAYREVAFMEPFSAGESESVALQSIFELTVSNAASLLRCVCQRWGGNSCVNTAVAMETAGLPYLLLLPSCWPSLRVLSGPPEPSESSQAPRRCSFALPLSPADWRALWMIAAVSVSHGFRWQLDSQQKHIQVGCGSCLNGSRGWRIDPVVGGDPWSLTSYSYSYYLKVLCRTKFTL